MSAFWEIYKKRIWFLAIAFLLIWIPSFFVAWYIDEGTYPAESLSGQIASAYFEFLRFPVARIAYELTKTANGTVMHIVSIIGFFGGFLVDALIYASIFHYVWYRFVGSKNTT